MAILVLVEAGAKPDMVETIKGFVAPLVPETRAYDGCQGITM
jgi:quinol monooxygenase YgiN